MGYIYLFFIYEIMVVDLEYKYYLYLLCDRESKGGYRYGLWDASAFLMSLSHK